MDYAKLCQMLTRFCINYTYTPLTVEAVADLRKRELIPKGVTVAGPLVLLEDKLYQQVTPDNLLLLLYHHQTKRKATRTIRKGRGTSVATKVDMAEGW